MKTEQGLWKLMLKDDEDLSKLPLKDGASIMLIGTAEVVKEPQEKVSPWVGADAAAFVCVVVGAARAFRSTPFKTTSNPRRWCLWRT